LSAALQIAARLFLLSSARLPARQEAGKMSRQGGIISDLRFAVGFGKARQVTTPK
jgi:hypothetical protein